VDSTVSEGLTLLLLVGLQQAPHRARLHGHDGHGVRDDVVELPRDPLPLLRDRAVRGGRLLALGLPRALGHLAQVLGAAAEDVSARPRDAHEDPKMK
jgi:hypothetical protein